jgi:antitoxin ParD1/3/4
MIVFDNAQLVANGSPEIPNFCTSIQGGFMAGKNTFFSIGEHFIGFVDAQVQKGRHSNTSDVIRAALGLLEDRETKLAALRAALIEGEESGPSTPFDFEAFIAHKQNATPKSA